MSAQAACATLRWKRPAIIARVATPWNGTYYPMLIRFHPHGQEDYLYWKETDQAMLGKVNALIEAIRREPFSGLGKPEPLRHDLRGYWSRRITDEHRPGVCRSGRYRGYSAMPVSLRRLRSRVQAPKFAGSHSP